MLAQVENENVKNLNASDLPQLVVMLRVASAATYIFELKASYCCSVIHFGEGTVRYTTTLEHVPIIEDRIRS